MPTPAQHGRLHVGAELRALGVRCDGRRVLRVQRVVHRRVGGRLHTGARGAHNNSECGCCDPHQSAAPTVTPSPTAEMQRHDLFYRGLTSGRRPILAAPDDAGAVACADGRALAAADAPACRFRNRPAGPR